MAPREGLEPKIFAACPRLPLGGQWTPSEALALNALILDEGGRYQICTPNAFNRYGLHEHIPARLRLQQSDIQASGRWVPWRSP